MKAKTNFKKILLATFFLLAILLACFFYFGISDAEHDREFNIYTLIPNDTKAVLVTEEYDDVCAHLLSNNIKGKLSNSVFDSKLLNLTLQHFTPFTSKLDNKVNQSNEVLISFHAPYTHLDQVFFSKLSRKGYNALQKYLKRNVEESFPYKLFMYRGEEIRIYTLDSGDFLAFYLTPRYFAVSFQKKLIEKVIDTYLDETSILTNPSFYSNCIETVKHKSNLYLKLDSVVYGKKFTLARNICDWVAFDFQMKSQGVFCKGVSETSDSIVQSLNHVLALQEKTSVSKIPQIPSTTCYLSHWSVSNIQAVFDYYFKSDVATDSMNVSQSKVNTLILQEFLAQQITDNLTGIQFKDSIQADSCHTLMIFPLKEPLTAKQKLIDFYFKAKRDDKQMPPRRLKWIHGEAYTIYSLPINQILNQFTGDITSGIDYDYAIVYQNNLLISTQMHSLVNYISFIETSDTLKVLTEEFENLHLKSDYQLSGYMDFDLLLDKPNHYSGFILPSVVLYYSEVLKNFRLFYQFDVKSKETSLDLNFVYKK